MSFQELWKRFLFFWGLDKKSSFVQDQLDLTNLRTAVPITIYTLVAARSMYNRTVLLWHLVSADVYNSLFMILAICSGHLLIYSLVYLFVKKARSHAYAAFSIYLYVIACCLAGQMIAIYDYAIGKQVFIFLPLVAWIFALLLINPISSTVFSILSFYLIPSYTNNRVVMSNYVNRILMMFAVMLEIISIVRWITQVRAARAAEEIDQMNVKLSDMSMKDELTGLKNRHALRVDYDRYQKKAVVASMCDIDDFKYYNDTYGHDAGDLILKHMGSMLARHFGHESVYRFGGDEFLIIEQDWSKEAFETAMDLWKKEFRDFDYDGNKLRLGSTCGYCCGKTEREDDLRQMISQADQKLYEGKTGQKGGVSGCDYVREEGKKTETHLRNNLRPGQFDSVTLLPNLTYFRSKARISMDILSSSQETPVLAYFNLTNFSGYNRRYGYEAGDRLLKAVGEMLSGAFEEDLICRLSDDHFALITKRNGLEETLSALPFEMEKLSRDYPVAIRAGLYEVSDHSVDISYASDCARKALEYGNENELFCWYDDRLREIVRRRQYVRDQFETAVENGWISIVTQPIIRTVTKHVAGMEILSRWNDPELGQLFPDDYIPLLEEAGTISDHDLFVLKKSTENYRNRRNTEIPVVPWVINLSGRDFDRCDLTDRILEITKDTDHSLIHFDISVSTLSNAKPHVKEALQKLSLAGFELWIDGFGSGSSVIDILSAFRFSGIKVDIRSLQEVAKGGRESIILSHIVSMCKALGISTLALGVETEEEMNFLSEIGFEFIQGYYLSGKDSYEQYAARKEVRTYEIEPLQSRDYYAKISRVNLSRPTQVGKNSQMETLAAEIPAAICERRNGRITCLRTNRAFRNFLPLAGFEDIRAYEEKLNEEGSRLREEILEIFRKMKDSDAWETAKIGNEKFTCAASFHRIASDPKEDALSVIGTVLDLSSYQKMREEEKNS